MSFEILKHGKTYRVPNLELADEIVRQFFDWDVREGSTGHTSWIIGHDIPKCEVVAEAYVTRSGWHLRIKDEEISMRPEDKARIRRYIQRMIKQKMPIRSLDTAPPETVTDELKENVK